LVCDGAKRAFAAYRSCHGAILAKMLLPAIGLGPIAAAFGTPNVSGVHRGSTQVIPALCAVTPWHVALIRAAALPRVHQHKAPHANLFAVIRRTVRNIQVALHS
jgi:hypothetical protein